MNPKTAPDDSAIAPGSAPASVPTNASANALAVAPASGPPNASADSPTLALYSALQRAFDHFNAELFDGRLPHCLISLRSSSRIHGYHHHRRFIAPDGREIDELGLHPGFFTMRPVEEVLSTLVHEMAHHWQRAFGTPTDSNPHNREWTQKMEALGLPPSSTGLPGGRQTGRSMSHYIHPEGTFIASCRRLLATGFALPWLDRHSPEPVEHAEHRRAALVAAGVDLPLSDPPFAMIPPTPNGASPVVPPPPKREPTRVRFSCKACDARAWASPETALVCGVCARPMEAGEK